MSAAQDPADGDLRQALQALAAARLSGRFAVATGSLAAFATTTLFPSEISTSSAAHPRRWAGFRGGRACARAALAALGQPPVAIPVGASGAPLWPTGFVGSISHTDHVAAAIVAASPPLDGIGLDVESDAALEDEAMVRLVCRPEELVPGRAAAHADNRRRGKLLFVIKEAVYKLYSPLSGTFLDFHDVTVAIDDSAGTFRADIVAPQLRRQGVGERLLGGAFTRVDNLYVALALPTAE